MTKPTCAVSLPIACYCLHLPSPFVVTKPKSWHSFCHLTESRRLSRPSHFSRLTKPSTVISVISVRVCTVQVVYLRNFLWQTHKLPIMQCNCWPYTPQLPPDHCKPCSDQQRNQETRVKPCNDTGISSGDSRHTRGCPNKFGQCCKHPHICTCTSLLTLL